MSDTGFGGPTAHPSTYAVLRRSSGTLLAGPLVGLLGLGFALLSYTGASEAGTMPGWHWLDNGLQDLLRVPSWNGQAPGLWRPAALIALAALGSSLLAVSVSVRVLWKNPPRPGFPALLFKAGFFLAWPAGVSLMTLALSQPVEDPGVWMLFQNTALVTAPLTLILLALGLGIHRSLWAVLGLLVLVLGSLLILASWLIPGSFLDPGLVFLLCQALAQTGLALAWAGWVTGLVRQAQVQVVRD